MAKLTDGTVLIDKRLRAQLQAAIAERNYLRGERVTLRAWVEQAVRAQLPALLTELEQLRQKGPNGSQVPTPTP